MENVRKIVKKGNEEIEDFNDWVNTDTFHNFNIYKKGAKKPSAHLAFQIKLCNQKEAAIVGQQPLFYVLFSSGDNWSIDEFLLHKAVSEGFDLEYGFVWRRYDENEEHTKSQLWSEEAEFAFVLPLVALNTPEDLMDLVVDPICSLMTNELDSPKFNKQNFKFEVKDSKIKLLS